MPSQCSTALQVCATAAALPLAIALCGLLVRLPAANNGACKPLCSQTSVRQPTACLRDVHALPPWRATARRQADTAAAILRVQVWNLWLLCSGKTTIEYHEVSCEWLAARTLILCPLHLPSLRL